MTSFVTHSHDLDDVCNLLERFIGESLHAKRSVKPAGVAKMLASPSVLTVMAYRSGEPVGIVMAYTWEHPMFTGKAASDVLLYVLPEHRGSSLAVRLIKMFEHWAREQGCEGVMLGQSTQIGDMRRVMKFYEKLGFGVTGFNCFKEL